MSYHQDQFTHPFPIPVNEGSREEAIAALRLHDRRGDPFLDHVVTLVQRIFDVPAAFVGLITGVDQRFLCIDGLTIDGTPRSQSVCAHTVARGAPIVVPSLATDPRFRDLPIVASSPHLRYAVSAPIILSSGLCPGSVCALDFEPREAPTDDQVAQLESVAALVANHFEQQVAPRTDVAPKLDAAERTAQDRFLALVGHELRTPLNGIMGLAEVLEPADDTDREIVTALRASASRLHSVIERILTFTDLRSGAIHLEEIDVHLTTLLRHIVRTITPIMTAENRTITLDIPDEEIRVTADPIHLELAIGCLIENARAHGGRNITVSLSCDDGVQIAVQDDGPGIPELRRPELWQGFELGAAMTTRRADGLGLGLPLVRHIVELHSGRVDLSPPGEGLTVNMSLPDWRLLYNGVQDP